MSRTTQIGNLNWQTICLELQGRLGIQFYVETLLKFPDRVVKLFTTLLIVLTVLLYVM